MADNRKPRRLTAEAEERIADFEREYGREGCSCHFSAPCNWCTHQDNSHHVHEEDGAWEADVPDIDYLGAARELVEGRHA